MKSHNRLFSPGFALRLALRCAQMKCFNVEQVVLNKIIIGSFQNVRLFSEKDVKAGNNGLILTLRLLCSIFWQPLRKHYLTSLKGAHFQGANIGGEGGLTSTSQFSELFVFEAC